MECSVSQMMRPTIGQELAMGRVADRLSCVPAAARKKSSMGARHAIGRSNMSLEARE
jgi:hypothetical protein